jgi:transcriptional regulator with GAF, ATPase, and Fis domain
VILSKGPVLNGSLDEPGNATPFDDQGGTARPVTLLEAERSHIIHALRIASGVVGGMNGAAARLGLPRTTLIAKLRRLRIDPMQVREHSFSRAAAAI